MAVRLVEVHERRFLSWWWRGPRATLSPREVHHGQAEAKIREAVAGDGGRGRRQINRAGVMVLTPETTRVITSATLPMMAVTLPSDADLGPVVHGQTGQIGAMAAASEGHGALNCPLRGRKGLARRPRWRG
jgi:hypothetical protein